MPAITVTQEILNKNDNRFLNGKSIGDIVIASYPNKFWVTKKTDCAYNFKTDLHTADGWKPVRDFTADPALFKRGQLLEDTNDFYYEEVAYTEQELQNRIQSESEANRQDLIQQELEKQVIEDAQMNDDTVALDNQDLYPMWEYPKDYILNEKCQSFDGTDLNLYKCIQPHTSQSAWQPKDVPALFVKVAYPNEIPDWVQPTGAQDAYQTGDQVVFEGQIWESSIDANVWSPTALPSGWTLIGDA